MIECKAEIPHVSATRLEGRELPKSDARNRVTTGPVKRRNGTASLFVAFEPLGGWRGVGRHRPRRREDWARFVRDLVDGRYRQADKVVLVMDQLNTHSPASLYEAFVPEEAKRLADRLEFHHSPKHGSWLNMAVIELSVLGRDPGLRRGRLCRTEWQFTAKDARIKLRQLSPIREE